MTKTTQKTPAKSTSRVKIYATEAVANMISGKMTKHSGEKYHVVRVTSGFQVCPVTVITAPVIAPTIIKLGVGPVQDYRFIFERQTKDWFYVQGGYIHKGAVIGTPKFEQDDEVLVLRMEPKVAAKKGYDKFAIQTA